MKSFTLTVTMEHLALAIEESKSTPTRSIADCCAIVQSFRHKFPENTERLVAGMNVFFVGKVAFSCDEARSITNPPMTVERLKDVLPLTLEFVKLKTLSDFEQPHT